MNAEEIEFYQKCCEFANDVNKQVRQQELMKDIISEANKPIHTNIDVKQQTKKQNDDILVKDANKILKLLLGEA